MNKLKRRIEVKISDGDVSGAVRILSSDSTLASHTLEMASHIPETLNALHSRHPSAPSIYSLPAPRPSYMYVHCTSLETVAITPPRELLKQFAHLDLLQLQAWIN